MHYMTSFGLHPACETTVNEATVTWKMRTAVKNLQEVINTVDEDADGAGDGGYHHDTGSHNPDHLLVSGLHSKRKRDT